jgi:hypothetical protein
MAMEQRICRIDKRGKLSQVQDDEKDEEIAFEFSLKFENTTTSN